MGKAINIANSNVSAKDDAFIYNAAFFKKNGVYKWGNNLGYELETNNKINIKDGMAVVNGRVYVIYSGTTDSLNIATGSQNTNRKDLVVLEFDATNETLRTLVVQGTPSEAAVDPALVQQDTLRGGSKYQLPLYRININGISVSRVDDLRTYIDSYTSSEVDAKIAAAIGSAIGGSY